MKNKNSKLFIFIFCLTLSLATCPTKYNMAHANNLYFGASIGESQGKIAGSATDDKQAYTFSFGSSFDIPLFPIRTELEYGNYKMSRNTIGTTDAKSFGIATYVSLPLLPIIIPYIGISISAMQEHYTNPIFTTDEKSGWEFAPQYITGIDLDLPTVPIAGSLEYRFINHNFNFDIGEINSKYNIFLVKARIKF